MSNSPTVAEFETHKEVCEYCRITFKKRDGRYINPALGFSTCTDVDLKKLIGVYR